MYSANTLNAKDYIKKRIMVTKIEAKAYTNLIYNFPLSPGTTYSHYNVVNDDVVAFN
jgi:hypothetical protein